MKKYSTALIFMIISVAAVLYLSVFAKADRSSDDVMKQFKEADRSLEKLNDSLQKGKTYIASMLRSGLSDSSLIGTWKGSSLCQIKSSPCHDETVVYHISKASGIDSFIVQANKIVNGIEEDMGPLVCRFERKTDQLICEDDKAVWTFNIKDGSMTGTLLVRGALYRIVRLKKQD